jgi:hypothetical protein
MVHIAAETENACNPFYGNRVMQMYMFRKFETNIIDMHFSNQLHAICLTLHFQV